MVPNLGDYESEGDWERVLDRFRGTGLQNYLQSLKEGDVTVARKPQYVDQIPNQFDGNTRELLERTDDERGALDSLIDRLNIRPVMDQPIDSISGGELQRVAIAACLARDADFYFLDEITPYLDIGQRMSSPGSSASWRTTTRPSARCSSSSTTSPSWTCSPIPSTSRTGSPARTVSSLTPSRSETGSTST